MELLLVLVCRNTQSESTGDLFTTLSTYKTKIATAKIEYATWMFVYISNMRGMRLYVFSYIHFCAANILDLSYLTVCLIFLFSYYTYDCYWAPHHRISLSFRTSANINRSNLNQTFSLFFFVSVLVDDGIHMMISFLSSSI
jgi:hypothetical protein